MFGFTVSGIEQYAISATNFADTLTGGRWQDQFTSLVTGTAALVNGGASITRI